MKINKNYYISILRYCFFGVLLLPILDIYQNGLYFPESGLDTRNFLIFYFGFLPSSLIGILYYLNVLISEISIEDDVIHLARSSFFKFKKIDLDPNCIVKMKITGTLHPTLRVYFSNLKSQKLEVSYLTNFDGDWIHPLFKFNNTQSRTITTVHKIALTISKKYNIPLDAPLLDESYFEGDV